MSFDHVSHSIQTDHSEQNPELLPQLNSIELSAVTMRTLDWHAVQIDEK